MWRNKPHNKTQKSPNQFATTSESPVTMEASVVNSNETKTRPKTTRMAPATTTTIITEVRLILTPTIRFSTIPPQTKRRIKKTENSDLSTHSVRPVVKLTIPRRNVIWEQTQLMDRLPGKDGRKDRIGSNKEKFKAIQIGIFKLQPKF